MKIGVLPDTVINQIAAGEVVERPVNVVKELVENALDADARRVEIAIEGGGIKRIRITDDGCGMARHDLMLCVERHATSKIRSFDDLTQLHSMGFRGEALPSIASVSRMHITSRQPDELTGHCLHIEGGRMTEVREEGANPGTRVEIADLFYNVPARKKFLRTPQTEQNLITSLVQSFALAHPQTAFSYSVDGRAQFQFPPATIDERIRQVFGRENAAALREGRSQQDDGTGFHLYLSRPDNTRSRRDSLYFFVNRRHVKDRLLGAWLQRAYRHLIPQGRHPFGALFLNIDPALVDVNVHPTKTEVRFFDIGALGRLFEQAIRQVLIEGETPFHSSPEPPAPAVPRGFPSTGGWSSSAPHRNFGGQISEPAPAILPPSHLPARHGQPASPYGETPLWESAAPSTADFQILGQFQDTFIVGIKDEELILVDQHAAMERINFEEISDLYADNRVEQQPLLFPHPIGLTPQEQLTLNTHMPQLQAMGFTIDIIDDTACLVEAPLDLPPQQAMDTIREICSRAGEEKDDQPESAQESFRQLVMKTMACHRSVKANKTLNHQQMEELLQRLFQCRQPYTCPHGRPTLISCSREQLWKQFLR